MKYRLFVTMIIFFVSLSAATQANASGCMRLYGNWCGTGVPVSGSSPPPVDDYDVACMHHDQCMADRFMNKKACDIGFVNELNHLRRHYGSMPRPLEWAEYVLRIRSGGDWRGMPVPQPRDPFGMLRSFTESCW